MILRKLRGACRDRVTLERRYDDTNRLARARCRVILNAFADLAANESRHRFDQSAA